MSSGTRGRRRGVVLILFALSILVIFGFIGLAFDVGRLYIARNEAQGYCDAAALAAAYLLDGTATGIDAARNAALSGTFPAGLNSSPWKQYHFQTLPFSGITVEFSSDFTPSGGGSWSTTPDPATARFVRVTATAAVPLYLSAVLTGQQNGVAQAYAIGAQVKMTTISEGLVPFTVIAHCAVGADGTSYGGLPACNTTCTSAGGVETCLGLTEGLAYTLRWGSNVWQQSFKKTPVDTDGWCSGDAVPPFPDQLKALYDAGELNRLGGFWKSDYYKGASIYADMLTYMSVDPPVSVDGILGFDPNPPQVQAIEKAWEDRINLMGNPPVIVPVVDPITEKIVDFYAFELVPITQKGGTGNWCAKFLGPNKYGGGSDPVIKAGITEVRLVR